MYRTHLLFGLFLALVFLPLVINKLVFVPIVLLCSLLPDIDCTQSLLGKYKIFRPLQWFVKHRTFFHSMSLSIIVALIFAFYIPVLALPFFLGYSGHLFADAITIEGIRPWWPYKNEIKGKIRTGGKIETIVFYVLVALDIGLIARMIF